MFLAPILPHLNRPSPPETSEGRAVHGATGSQPLERYTVLDRCLVHMEAEIGKAAAALRPIGSATLDFALADLESLVEPRPPHLQQLVGAERLRVDMRFGHRAIARLNDTYQALSGR